MDANGTAIYARRLIVAVQRYIIVYICIGSAMIRSIDPSPTLIVLPRARDGKPNDDVR